MHLDCSLRPKRIVFERRSHSKPRSDEAQRSILAARTVRAAAEPCRDVGVQLTRKRAAPARAIEAAAPGTQLSEGLAGKVGRARRKIAEYIGGLTRALRIADHNRRFEYKAAHWSGLGILGQPASDQAFLSRRFVNWPVTEWPDLAI